MRARLSRAASARSASRESRDAGDGRGPRHRRAPGWARARSSWRRFICLLRSRVVMSGFRLVVCQEVGPDPAPTRRRGASGAGHGAACEGSPLPAGRSRHPRPPRARSAREHRRGTLRAPGRWWHRVLASSRSAGDSAKNSSASSRRQGRVSASDRSDEAVMSMVMCCHLLSSDLIAGLFSSVGLLGRFLGGLSRKTRRPRNPCRGSAACEVPSRWCSHRRGGLQTWVPGLRLMATST